MSFAQSHYKTNKQTNCKPIEMQTSAHASTEVTKINTGGSCIKEVQNMFFLAEQTFRMCDNNWKSSMSSQISKMYDKNVKARKNILFSSN